MRATYHYKGMVARREFTGYYRVTLADRQTYVGAVFRDSDNLWQAVGASDTDYPKTRLFIHALRQLKGEPK